MAGRLARLGHGRPQELGDIVILDVPEYANVAKGKALDLMEMAPHGKL